MQTRELPKTQVELLLAGGYQERSVRAAVERVNRGMKRLDGHSKNWMGDLNLRKLRLEDGEFCVLGQVFGEYDEGKDEIGLSETQAIAHGFNSPPNMSFYRATQLLDVVWTHAVSARNTAKRPVFLRMPA